MTRIALFALALIGAASTVSCRVRTVVVEHDGMYTSGPREEMVVGEQPPAAEAEAVPTAPSPNHVWVAGYWAHHYGNWVWISGCYVVRPPHRTAWVAGHWERHPRGWVWVYGRWA